MPFFWHFLKISAIAFTTLLAVVTFCYGIVQAAILFPTPTLFVGVAVVVTLALLFLAQLTYRR